MKRATINITILAVYLVLVVALLVGIFTCCTQMIAEQKKSDVVEDNGKFSSFDIIINDEITLFLGQETVLAPYLMSSVDGTIKSTKFEYSSSCPEVTVDNMGKLKAVGEPKEDAIITIVDIKTGTETKIKVKVLTSLGQILGILNGSGLIGSNQQSFVYGEETQLTVSTEPKDYDIKDICDITVTDKNGKTKNVFDINVVKNKINLTPIGIGEGKMTVSFKNEDGGILKEISFDFKIDFDNDKLSDAILESSGIALMEQSDFAKVTSLTLESEDNVTDMNDLSQFTGLKTITLASTKVMTLNNLRNNVTYRVHGSVYENYYAQSEWRSLGNRLVPCDPNDDSAVYVVYHNTNSDASAVKCLKVGESAPTYSNDKGQRHNGWVDENGTRVNPGSVTKTTHLYSEWLPLNFTIVYHVDNKTYSEKWSYTNTTLKKVTSIPGYTAKPGYVFTGWCTSSSRDFVSFSPDTAFTALNSYVTEGGEIHLYDVWESIEYTIRFQITMGIGVSTHSDIKVVGASSYYLEDLYVIGTGYSFEGWETPDGKILKPGTNYDTIATANGQVVVLKAKLTEITYFIKYDLKGGYYIDENGKKQNKIPDANLLYNDQYTIPKAYKDGYYLAYWQGNDGQQYYPGNVVSRLFEEISMLQMTPVWEVISYTITFKAPDGFSFNTSPQNVYVTGTNTYELPDLNLSSKGYTFAGWKTEDGTILKKGANNKVLATENNQVVVLTANLSPVICFVSYKLNGGYLLDENGGKIFNPGNAEIKYNETFVVPMAYMDGMTFQYWLSDDGTKYYAGQEIYRAFDQMSFFSWTAVFA